MSSLSTLAVAAALSGSAIAANVTGPTLTPVTPSQNQINTLANAGQATCSQQLTNVITQEQIAGLALQTLNVPIALAAETAAAGSLGAAAAALTPSVLGAGDNAAGVALGLAG